MPNLTGQSIGRYHILEQLGEGGMATVYKAYDTRLERNVAFKVLRTDLFGSAIIEQILKRFEREAKSLAKLKHPNIVNILDFGEHEGSPYLVMEYLPGGTLKQKLGQKIPWQEAIHILIPVARGLSYAHQHGVIHRDVKPANILIDQNNEPILTDFGIAKLLEGTEGHTLTGSGVGIGTPEYMAPEQGVGAREIDARADIYSLGIVFYEMVTGRKPYIADTPMAVVLKQMTDPLPRPSDFVPDLPEGVEHILFKALAKQPDDRYADMDTMIAAMESVLSEVQKVEVPATPKRLKKKTLPRIEPSSKVVTAVIGVIGIVLIIIFGAPWLTQQFSPTPITETVSMAVPDFTSTFTITPLRLSATPKPSPTLRPTQTTWVADFSEPISAYMNTKRPSFEDDFSTAKAEWGQVWNWAKEEWRSYTEESRRDYSLAVSDKTVLPLTDLLGAGNFAISVDWALVFTDSLEFIFRSSNNESIYYKFIYRSGGNWVLLHNNGTKTIQLQSGHFNPIAGSEKSYSPEKGDQWSQIPLNNFLFIALEENLAVFVNGNLILEYNELVFYEGKNFFQVGCCGSGRAKMDNFKFWNLDGVEFK